MGTNGTVVKPTIHAFHAYLCAFNSQVLQCA